MDWSQSGSSVHEIFQAKVLEWAARGSSQPGDLPSPGSNPYLLHWQADSLLMCHLGSPSSCMVLSFRFSLLTFWLVHSLPQLYFNLKLAELWICPVLFLLHLPLLLTALLGMDFYLPCQIKSSNTGRKPLVFMVNIAFVILLHWQTEGFRSGMGAALGKKAAEWIPDLLPEVQLIFMNKCFLICCLPLVNF